MLLVKLERALHNLVDLTFKFPKTIVATTLTLTFLLGMGGMKLKQIVSMVDQLDPGMMTTHNTLKTRELFDAYPTIGFALRHSEGFSAERLCQVKVFLREMEMRNPSINGTFSAFDVRQLSIDSRVAFYPAILSDPCERSGQFSLLSLQKSPWEHLLTNSSLSDFNLSFSLRLDRPTSFGTFDPIIVGNIIKEIKNEFGDDVPLFGTLAQEFFTMEGLGESKWLNVMIVGILFLGFRFFFGTWRAAPLYVITLLIAATMIYGAMGWMGHAMDPLSVCLFLMLAISSMEDFIFISQKKLKTDDLESIFKEMALPCLFTSLTTFCAFLTLSFSQLQSIRHFGLWAAVGGLVEWFLTFIFLPAFLVLLPGFSKWTKKSRFNGNRFFLKLLELKIPRGVSLLSLLFFLSALVSVNNFKLSQTPTEMFPKDHPFQQSLDFLLKDRGWVAHIDFVMTSQISQRDKVDLLDFLQKEEIVFRLESWPMVVDFVSHKSNQLTRQMVERELKTTDFSRRYVNNRGDERAIVYLKTSNTEKLNQLRKKIEDLCPHNECWISGEFVGFADFSQSLISTLFESLFLSILIVVGFISSLALYLKRGHLVVAMIFSSLWGPAVLLSMIYFFGISINFVTCVVASALVGLTGDNAIMFLCHRGASISEAIKERALASIQSALMMAICSLTFLFSYFEPPQMLGVLLSIGFISSLVGDVWLLKGFTKNKV
jgi:uncharacterized protein